MVYKELNLIQKYIIIIIVHTDAHKINTEQNCYYSQMPPAPFLLFLWKIMYAE